MNSVTYCSKAIVKYLRQSKAESVLDVGCGNGAMSRIIANHGFAVTAIEPDRAGFEIASQCSEISVHNLGVYEDTSALGKFDAVISSEVIEHLFEPQALLALAARHLKLNGRLIITCPFYGYTKNLLLSIANKWDDHHQPERVGGHIKLWSHHTMTEFIERNGFTVELATGAGRFWPLWASMVVVAKLKASANR